MATYYKTYTSAVTVDTGEVVIHKANTAGNGVIPNDISLRHVKIYPADNTKQIIVKGLHDSSGWITLPAGQAYEVGGLAADCWTVCYVKAGESITVNLEVEGQ